MIESARITPVILSGGSGTRLWPMSTPERPKQFLPLTSDRTMFQLTALRAQDAVHFEPPIIVANGKHAALVDDQLAELGIVAKAVILEPVARNTAPAIALAALVAAPDAVLLVMPSDHVITDKASFASALKKAQAAVNDGWLVTFGIAPTGPETGYGYIRIGEMLSEGVHRVGQFREKPDAKTAASMILSGDHSWNGGIFMFKAAAYLEALAIHAPQILQACDKAINEAVSDGTHLLPDEAAFASSPSDSIDYAVMEKADRVAVVPVSMGWSDVGSWDALYELGEKDHLDNHATPDVRMIESSGNLIRSDGIRISVSGVENLIIIASGNDVMILPRGQSQDVKKLQG